MKVRYQAAPRYGVLWFFSSVSYLVLPAIIVRHRRKDHMSPRSSPNDASDMCYDGAGSATWNIQLGG